MSEKTARRQLIFAADAIEALAQDRNPFVGAFEGYLTARARQLEEERGANKLSRAGEAYAGLYACAAMIEVFAPSSRSPGRIELEPVPDQPRERSPEPAEPCVGDIIGPRFERFLLRMKDGAPVLDADLRELERMRRVLQISAHLRFEDLDVDGAVRRMIARLEADDDVDQGDDHDRLASILAYRDRAYQERNRLACLVARLALINGWRAGTWRDPDGEPGFALVVGVDLPTGQVSWHMDERDPVAPWTALPTYGGNYDGHTDAEKWERVLASIADVFAGETSVDPARRALTQASLDPNPQVADLAREGLRVGRGFGETCPECQSREGEGPSTCVQCNDFRAREFFERTVGEYRRQISLLLGRQVDTAPPVQLAAEDQALLEELAAVIRQG